MSPSRRCFLISPIGAEGSPEREEADAVLEYIVKPAMERFGIEAFRSDQVLVPGEISDQMFRAIKESDLCIAVLTGRNPNVYYELAVAHVLERPVIILVRKGEELPFDIKDTRCVYYDLKPKPLFGDKVYANEIAAHVGNLDELGWRVPTRLSPLMESTASELQLFDRGEDLGAESSWMAVLASARRRFDAMGVSLWSWKQSEGFVDCLAQKADEGCRIRFLIADPASPAFPHFSRLELDRTERERTRAAIESMLELLRPLEQRYPDFDVRQLHRGIPHHQFTRTDDVAVVIPYWHTLSPSVGPAFRCTSGSAAYRLFVEDFQALWSLNEPPDRAG